MSLLAAMVFNTLITTGLETDGYFTAFGPPSDFCHTAIGWPSDDWMAIRWLFDSCEIRIGQLFDLRQTAVGFSSEADGRSLDRWLLDRCRTVIAWLFVSCQMNVS